MSWIYLFIFCLLEVNRMIRGHPNHQQTIGRAVTSQSRDESALVSDIPSLDDENKDAEADVADRDTDKSGDTENKHSSRQSIGNSSQTALDPIIQLQNNVNNNNNNTKDAQNKSQDYSNELISFFNKNNFINWNRRDNESEVESQRVNLPDNLISSVFNQTDNYKFVPVIPSHCEGQIFCDHAPDYPAEVVEEQLNQKSYLKQFATAEQPLELTQRATQSSSVTEISLCLTNEIKYQPKIGTNNNGVPKYIVQTPDLVQTIYGQACQNPGGPCRESLRNLITKNTMCVQKYISLPYVCLSHSGEAERDWFNVESSCCCYFK